MGSACCGNKEDQLSKVPKSQIRTLWVVLAINLVMFFVEFSSGLYAESLALTSDSFDMLGDAISYGATLYVVNSGIVAKARSAALKAWIVLFSGISLALASVYRTIFAEVPLYETMTIVGSLALFANLVCLSLLWKYRKVDINMASVWICSRNDIIANSSVLLAGGAVWLTNSYLPDLIVGIALAALFIRSSMHIFSESRREIAAVR